MSCCQDPINLGCFDSCQNATIESLTGHVANELYAKYSFNGASRKFIIAEVSDTGQPIIDLQKFNEDYFYTFEIIDLATDESLGCFKIKIEPCAGEYFETPPTPAISEYADTRLMLLTYDCVGGSTEVAFVVDIADASLACVKDGTIVNLAFSANVAVVGMTLYTSDANIEIISNTQFKILIASDLVNPIEMGLKLSDCNDLELTGVVASIENMAPTWGNGTHTPGTLEITF